MSLSYIERKMSKSNIDRSRIRSRFTRCGLGSIRHGLGADASSGARTTTMTELPVRPFRALSLDGGGMRGIYTAAFLDRLLSQQAKLADHGRLDLGSGIDLICGTSTGAIVACAVAIGCPLDRVVALYRQHGAAIFPHRITGTWSIFYRVLSGRRFVRAGDRALRSALTEVLRGITMADVFDRRGISLSVPAVDMSTHRSWVFKRTPVSGPRDNDYSLVDVCMASSAAPIFRSLADVGDPDSAGGARKIFADGGLWANNPVLVALTDAMAMAEADQPIEIFSLGTCPRPEGEHIRGDDVHRSLLQWRFGADVGPLAISAQEFAYDNTARLLAKELSKVGRSVRAIRFPRKDVPASMNAVPGARRYARGGNGPLGGTGGLGCRSDQERL